MLDKFSASQWTWRLYAWVPLSVLGGAMVGFLCWGAWIYGYNPQWLIQGSHWWLAALQTNQNWTLIVTMLLWLGALTAYWWPRRRDRIPIAVITVVLMVVLAAVLGVASYTPCRGHMSATGTIFWILQLYVGQPPNMVYQSVKPGAACLGQPPLALQLGQMDGLGATLIGAVAVAAMLWRQPFERLRSRFARKATVFTGLDALTLPLLIRLTDPAFRRNVIVIEPDETHPLLEEARATGARVVIGQPTLHSLLQPILVSWRGCALERLYVLRADAAENDAVLGTVREILTRHPPGPESHPHLVARIDDPRHAIHWRGGHGASSVGFEDALSPAETTAYTLVDSILSRAVSQLIICGDSGLSLAVLLELDRRNWEQRELISAAAIGRQAAAGTAGLPPPPEPLPISRVMLIDPHAAEIQRECAVSTPRSVADSAMTARPARWEDELLPVLDAMPGDAAGSVAVIIVGSVSAEGVHRAGRIARLHPSTWIYVQSAPSGTGQDAIFNRLRLFSPGLLVAGDIPEDTWMRVARHWHECFRLQDPVPPDHPKALSRLPWAELSDFFRRDNLLQVRSILSAVAELDRHWVPVRMVPTGSHIELSERELEAAAEAEHARWYQRRLAAGRDYGSTGGVRVYGLPKPWTDLSADERTRRKESVRSQIAQLEEVGFVPVVRSGGPAHSASYERVGIVDATQLDARYSWGLHRTGEELHGEVGDWRVIDDHGHERTVGDDEFRAAHDFISNGRWRRVGAFRAWRVHETLVLRTKEGRATATPGDWVVEGVNGERWPVSDHQFRRSYRRIPDEPGLANEASAPAATSSSTPPAISS